MSNLNKDHPSIRYLRLLHVFNLLSDLNFLFRRVHAPPGGYSNNIFGTDPEETHKKVETLAGQYKQAQMKSSIFDTSEPTPMRQVSNKTKSNIFGNNDDDEQSKHQANVRHGLRGKLKIEDDD